jgi:hypothetical protein
LVRSAPGLKFLRMDEGNAVFEVGSGSYKFATPMPSMAPKSNLPSNSR